MRPSFPRSVTIRLLAVFLVALMLTMTLSVVAQQSGVLRRMDNDQDSRIGDPERQPNTILDSFASPLFAAMDDGIDISVRYRCVTSQGGNDDNCGIGTTSGAGDTTRSIMVRYLTNGTTPTSTQGRVTHLTAQSQIIANNDLTFTGTIPAADTSDLADGAEVRWIVYANLTSSDDPDNKVRDPVDVSGEPYYALRADTSTPTVSLTDGARAVARQSDAGVWYLVTPGTTAADKAPQIKVTLHDDPSGSPIQLGAHAFFLRDENLTGEFDHLTGESDAHNQVFDLDYADVDQFTAGSANRLDVVAEDGVGHRLDTTAAGSPPAAWVALDESAPGFVDAQLELPSGHESSLVAPGVGLRVYANVTDTLGNRSDGSQVSTPKELMQVFATLRAGTAQEFADGNTTEESPAVPLPFNATCDCYHSPNVSIPQDWSTSGVVHAHIEAFDIIANGGEGNADGTASVDLAAPVMTPLEPLGGNETSGFSQDARVEFRVRIVDPGDTDPWNGPNTEDSDNLGVKQDSVRLIYSIADGPDRTSTMEAKSAEDTWAVFRTFNPEDRVRYRFTAEDFAGNTVRYPQTGTLSLQVDQVGPTVLAVSSAEYLGQDGTFRFAARDAGSGVDATGADLFWRESGTSGPFTEVAMTTLDEAPAEFENETDIPLSDYTFFEGAIPASARQDGATIEYYARVADQIGNTGTFGSITSPESALVDLTAPSNVTFDVDSTVNTARFTVGWSASDNQGEGTGSGIKDYTIQFRIGEAGKWVTLPELKETTATSFEMCALAQATYEFRGFARDNALNAGPLPDSAQTSTFVAADDSCAEAPSIEVTKPLSGATLSGAVRIEWTAGSTTFPPGEIVYKVQAGRGGEFQTIADGLAGADNYTWNTVPRSASEVCLEDGSYTLRVVARDPSGLEAVGTVESITLQNGISDCATRDLDGDGLPDEWEFAHFGNLAQGADDDQDGDGATNMEEFRAGTDPANAGSKPPTTPTGGGETPEEPEQAGVGWNNWYILVVLTFVGVLVAYVVGITRRW